MPYSDASLALFQMKRACFALLQATPGLPLPCFNSYILVHFWKAPPISHDAFSKLTYLYHPHTWDSHYPLNTIPLFRKEGYFCPNWLHKLLDHSDQSNFMRFWFLSFVNFSQKNVLRIIFCNHSFNKYLLKPKYASGTRLYLKLQNTNQSVEYLVCVKTKKDVIL